MKLTEGKTSAWDVLTEALQNEREQIQGELNEIALMLEQSQLEMNRLAQRNVSINTHLQQVQAQVNNSSGAEIRSAYDAALDAQQRLLVMRGQVEKLQSDHKNLTRYSEMIDRTLQSLQGESDGGTVDGRSQGLESVEMMIQAQEAERRRLSRKMHDGPAQALSNFILQTEIATRLFDVDQDKAREELNSLKNSASRTFQKVRNFIFDLRPMMLDDLGLIPTVKRYADTQKESSNLNVQVVVSGVERRLESYQEVFIFRATQELLANASQHGQADNAKVLVDLTDTEIRLRVEDDGKGFDPAILGSTKGLGLKLLSERAAMLGGDIDIHSKIGQGTEIVLRLPAATTSVFV